MAEKPRFGTADLGLLLVILVAAAGIRAGYLSGMADGARNDGTLEVQASSPRLTALPPGTALNGATPPPERDALVHNLKENGWFGCLAPFADHEERTAHTSPGYPYLLSWMGRVLASPDVAMRWVQCGLGALTAVLDFLFALGVFRSRLAATLAGPVWSLHAFLVLHTAARYAVTLTTL